MKNKKKILKYFLILYLLFVPFWIVNADSGWDSSYDSGGSSSDWGSSSSSDWGSSSSSGWGSSSHSSSDGSFVASDESLLVITVIIIVIIVILVIATTNKTDVTNGKYKNVPYISYQGVSEEKLQSILPGMTLDAMRKIAYDKFVEIQKAWMKFDYEKLRELCTDELYNSYVAQLEVLKLKNGQNIMESFELLNNKIIDVRVDNGEVTVKVYMRIRFYDYVIDTKTNRVIRGNMSVKICNNYEMEFIRKQNVDKEIHCPNCNAKVNHNTSGECEYCGSTIVKAADDFVLSKKTNINK